MTMRMAASIGLGVCGPLSVPRNRPQLAGQSPMVALKPAKRSDSTRVDAASCTTESLPFLTSTTTPKMPATPPHVHVCGAQPASLRSADRAAPMAAASGTSLSRKSEALVPANFRRLATNGDGDGAAAGPGAALSGAALSGAP